MFLIQKSLEALLNIFLVIFVKEFGEAATMLSATCDEFLKNICDCMDLAESNFGELLFHII